MRHPNTLARAALALLAVSAASGLAQAQTPSGMPSAEPTVAPVPNRVDRPLILPTGAWEAHLGAGVASSSIATSGGRSTVGAGVHLEAVAGLGRRFEIDAGTGLRFGTDGETLGADRYARVSREDVYQTGNRLIANPYLRARFGIFDRPTSPLHLGVDAMVVFPVASQTDWSFALGVPLHVVLARRVRIETGVFAQIVPAEGSSLRNVVNAPLRVNVAITDYFLAGITTGIAVGNVGTTDPSKAFVPFGVQIIWRAQARTDIVFQWLYPAAAPQGTNAVGFGLGLTAHRW